MHKRGERNHGISSSESDIVALLMLVKKDTRFSLIFEAKAGQREELTIVFSVALM
jgi:hypothetical protein